MKEPDDALIMIYSQFYKIGRFGYVYIWNDEWVRSTKTREDIEAVILARESVNKAARYRRKLYSVELPAACME